MLIFLVSIFAALLSWTVYTSLIHPLSRFPGPVYARLSKFWYIYQAWTGNLDQTWSRIHRQYGAFVRVAPDEISITDPPTVTRVLDAKGSFAKSEIYSMFEGRNGQFKNLLTIRDESQHSQRRRVLNSLYSHSGISKFEGAINDKTTELMNQLAVFSSTGATFDISQWLQR